VRDVLTALPEIDGGHLPAAGDDRIGQADLAIQLKLRACTASAREVVPSSAVLSTILTGTLSCVNHSANTKPVGPAPTMRTSVSRIIDALIAESRFQV
jgi:hypothetical protein